MKIIFFGTPEFAVLSLKSLFREKDIEIIEVITQPDKEVGRKRVLTPPPVKAKALELGLKVFQPQNKQELLEELKDKKVDFFVVIAFGMILNKEILNLPKIAPINVHASLLPKYRGASPIQEALLNGDSETGVSIMHMNAKMDQGDIYLIRKLPIDDQDNLETLTKNLASLSAKILPHILRDIKEQQLNPIPQSQQDVSYCQKISKEDGKINFNKTAREIKNMIRAYTPWPTAYTDIQDRKVQILEAEISNENLQKIPGEFIIEGNSLKFQTKNGILLPKKVKPEGKNIMDVKDFINGLKK